jgi:hypothetical protein
MPLGCREEFQDAQFCGLIAARSDDLPSEILNVARPAGFDFLAVPLSYSPDPANSTGPGGAERFLLDINENFSGQVVGIVHPCVSDLCQLNTPDSKEAAAALRRDISLARYAGVQAVLIPPPKTYDCCLGYGQARATLR